MIRRTRLWLAGDALFILGNVIGGMAALSRGEFRHASSHLILVLIGAAFAWVLLPGGSASTVESNVEFNDGLTRLQQSLDAVALEVERIGEGQRYVTQLFGKTHNAGADAMRKEI